MNNRFFAIIFIPLSILLIIIALLSLKWHMVHDAPIFMYFAYLIDHFNYVPYRDLFDVNLPGTYLIYRVVGRLFGYSDLAFRYFDLLYLSAILTMTWLCLKKISRQVAWCSVVLFGLLYLEYGPIMSVQRDYCIILPVTVALLIASSFPALNAVVKSILVGFLFGVAATIKPHAPIGLPLVILFQAWEARQHDNKRGSTLFLFIKIILAAIIGFAIPIIIMFLYLWRTAALTQFLDMAGNYWPLFGSLSGTFEVIPGIHRIAYLINEYSKLGSQALWLVPAGLGVYLSLFHSTLTDVQKRLVLLLLGLAVMYSIYPVFAGKFWQYHWLLFYYFVILLGSLCLVEQAGKANRLRRRLPIGLLLLTIFLGLLTPELLLAQFLKVGYRSWNPQNGRVGEIASYLKSHMNAGDTVQPLDFTGGAIHAMLLAKAEIATPYPYDILFYYPVSSSYIQNLRQKFLISLNEGNCRFVISIVGDRQWISGPDSTRVFNELQSQLNSHYRTVLEGSGYVVYERMHRF